MAQKDSIIKNLEHMLEEKEKEIEAMKESMSGGEPVSKERLMAFEKRMVEMEVLIKGLTEELLDLKTIVMKINKNFEDRTISKPRIEIAKPAPERSVHTVPAEGGAKGRGDSMAMIMQPDGTLKPEKRENHGVIVASTKHTVPLSKKAQSGTLSEDIIVGKNVYEKDTRPVKPLITAKEEDPEKKKKNK